MNITSTNLNTTNPIKPASSNTGPVFYVTPFVQSNFKSNNYQKKLDTIATRVDAAIDHFNQCVDLGKGREVSSDLLSLINRSCLQIQKLKKRKPTVFLHKCDNFQKKFRSVEEKIKTMRREEQFQSVSPSNSNDSGILGIVTWLSESFSLQMASAAPLENKLSAEDYLKLAKDYVSEGRTGKAYEAYTESIQLDNTNSETYYLRGVLGVELGFWTLAKNDFLKILTLPPQQDFLELNYYLGLIHLELDEIKQAYERFDRANQLLFKGSNFYYSIKFHLLNLLIQEGKSEAWLNLLNEIRESKVPPGHISHYYYFRGLEILLEDPKAFDRAQPFFELARNSENLIGQLIFSSMKLDRHDIALEYSQKIIEQSDGEHFEASFAVAYFSWFNTTDRWEKGFPQLLNAMNNPNYGYEEFGFFRNILKDLSINIRSSDKTLFTTAAEKLAKSRSGHLTLEEHAITGSLYFYGGNSNAGKPYFNYIKNIPFLRAIRNLVFSTQNKSYLEWKKELKDFVYQIMDGKLFNKKEKLFLLAFSYLSSFILDRNFIPQTQNEALEESSSYYKYLFPGIATIACVALVALYKFRRCFWGKQAKVDKVEQVFSNVQKKISTPRSRAVSSAPEPKRLDFELEQFEIVLNKLFQNSKSSLSLEGTFATDKVLKGTFKCNLLKNWLLVEPNLERYGDVIYNLYKKVDSKIYSKEKLFVIEVERQDHWINNDQGKKAIKEISKIDDLIFGQNEKEILPAKTEVQETLPPLEDVKKIEILDAALYKIFGSISSIEVDLKDNEIFVVLYIKTLYKDLFSEAESKKLVSYMAKVLGDSDNISVDFFLSKVSFSFNSDRKLIENIPPIDPEELFPPSLAHLTPLIERKEEHKELEKFEAEIGYSATEEKSVEQIWRGIHRSKDLDSSRIQSLSSIINLLEECSKHPGTGYAKKFLIIRFLEIYKRLSFLSLWNGENEEVQAMRNALLHYYEFLKDDELIKIINKILELKSFYQEPYEINRSLVARYCLRLQQSDYINFLLKEVDAKIIEAGSELEMETLKYMLSCCSDFNKQIDVPHLVEAHRLGVILTIRELMQSNNMSLATKRMLDTRIAQEIGNSWAYTKYVLHRDHHQFMNLLTDMGNRIAHGNERMVIPEAELKVASDGFIKFSHILKDFV